LPMQLILTELWLLDRIFGQSYLMLVKKFWHDGRSKIGCQKF